MEIYIRAWDENHRTMEYIDDLYWFEESGVRDFGGSGHFSNYKFQLYSGLFDDTGKRIYDKDIVEVTTASGHKYISEVTVHPFGTYISVKSSVNEMLYKNTTERLISYCDYGVGEGLSERCIILGNVFQNPELLD